MPTIPSFWDSGAEWTPEETEGAGWVWLADDWDVGLTGRPHVFVAIAGRMVNGFGSDSVALQSGTWTMGRADWFDVLSPGSGSFTFFGVVEAASGDEVRVTTEGGTLWVGTVKGVTQTQDTAGHFRTTVSAVDVIGRLGGAVEPRNSVTIEDITTYYFPFSGETMDTVTQDYLDRYAGFPVTLTIGDSEGTLPTLINWSDPPDVTLLDILNNLERTSNAMLAFQPDGSLILVMRDALASEEVPVIDLVGLDAPYSWTIDRGGANVINHWILTQPAYNDSEVILDEVDAESVEVYGDQTYSVSDYLSDTHAHFKAGLKAAMAVERPLLAEGRFHVTDSSQAVLHLAPLSWVRQGDETWQVMSVTHEFSGSAWGVSITGDVNQNAMVGDPEPDPEEPPDVTTDTQTLTSTKSSTVVLSGSTEMGNGAGDYLPVGYYDGFKHRALIDWTGWDWPDGFIRVKKATLHLRTSGQVWVAFGSKPRFYARRIKESWSEGSYDAAPPSQYSVSNSVIWPGPERTTSGQVLKRIGTAEDNDITVDVTDIMQAAHAGTFHGIMLVSANEGSNVACTEFYSDNHATSGWRPQLVLTCEVEA